MVDGFHVPVTALVDVVGKAGAALFWQSGPIWLKVGVTCVVITIAIVAVLAH